MNTTIYSFDIFDTCLVRTCGTPDCILDIVARRILKEPSLSAINDFILIRKSGEGRARKQFITSEKEDITLTDIYSQCDFSSLTDISNSTIMEMEMTVEAEMLTPVLYIKEEIEHLHSLQQPIIFISDMYLPEDFIKDLLRKKGFFKEGDKLFISGHVGKTKSTGNLFLHVQQILKADIRNWYHKGDSRHSDYDIPRSIGIKAFLVSNEKSYYEKKILEYDTSLSKLDIAKISSLTRAIRLSFPDTPHYRFAADFIAPLMTSFVHSIMEDATNRGLHHLYFIARDACILYNIALQLIHRYPTLSIHYLYASRQSLYQPDENCLPYLQQEGLTRPHSAIIDMVGSRRCQESINKLLSQHGYDNVYAYYYEVTPYRIMTSDKYSAMYYQEKLAGCPHYHHASHPLFEQYFGITDQLRTIGYRQECDNIVPIFENDLVATDYKRRIFNTNREVCILFAMHYVNLYIIEPTKCNNICFATFSQFCHAPRKEYLSSLHEFISTSSKTEQEPLLIKRNLFSIIFNKHQYLRWKQGNIVYNSGFLYRPIIALLQWFQQYKIRQQI